MATKTPEQFPAYAVKAVTRTTISCSHLTKERLARYRRGVTTYDIVLNELMDRVPIDHLLIEEAQREELRTLIVEATDLDALRAGLLQRLNQPMW